MVTFAQQVFPVGFIQCDGDGARRGVPVFVDVRIPFFHGNMQVVCHTLNDSDISLVGDDKCNVLAG